MWSRLSPSEERFYELPSPPGDGRSFWYEAGDIQRQQAQRRGQARGARGHGMLEGQPPDPGLLGQPAPVVLAHPPAVEEHRVTGLEVPASLASTVPARSMPGTWG